MSEELIVCVETFAGSRLVGKVASPVDFSEAVEAGRPVELQYVFNVVTLNMPVGPQNVVRVTKLAKMDFCDGPLDSIKVQVSSYYVLDDEAVKRYIEPEINDIVEREKRPPQAEPSNIVQARAVPRFVPGIMK